LYIFGLKYDPREINEKKDDEKNEIKIKKQKNLRKRT